MQKLQLFLAGFPPQTKSTVMLLLLEDISFITVNHKLFTIIRVKKVMMIRTHKSLKYKRSVSLMKSEPTARINFFQALLYELGFLALWDLF